jgi:uncharacterized spore protein YtfJ
MQDVAELFTKTVQEIEKMLNTKTVVGEPLKVDGTTLIPLVSVGFGFAAAGGSGTDPKKGAGNGGGTGGGGGIKPVALVIVGPNGVRVETIKSGTASVLDKAIDTVGAAIKERTAPQGPASGG